MSGETKTKLTKGFTIAETIVAGVFTAAFFVMFVLTGGYIIRLVISAAWLIFALRYLFKESRRALVISLIRLLYLSPHLLLFTLFAPMISQSHFAFRYPLQKAVISIYNGDDTFQYFPSRLPKGIKNYRLDFLPAIMQADGFTTMSFKASDDVIEQYTEEYSKGALYTCTFADLGSSMSVLIDEKGVNPTNKYADVRMDDRFKKECSDDAMVYIMYHSKDSHRSSYTSAVVIDSTNNMIEFTKIG